MTTRRPAALLSYKAKKTVDFYSPISDILNYRNVPLAASVTAMTVSRRILNFEENFNRKIGF